MVADNQYVTKAIFVPLQRGVTDNAWFGIAKRCLGSQNRHREFANAL